MKKFIPRGIPCLVVLGIIFGYVGGKMGVANMMNTIMHTAFDLLINTCFFLMAVCVITSALCKLFIEFGVVDLLQKVLRPIMKPVFNMPGVASLAAVLTFLSDNPAIIALSQDKGFACYFKKYQHVSLVNFGTAFGMGLIVIVFMVGLGFTVAPFVGFAAALCGCVVSTRLMQHFTCKAFPNYRTEAVYEEGPSLPSASPPLWGENGNDDDGVSVNVGVNVEQHQDTLFVRVLNALLDGGKSGVDIGLAIIPGVVIISTFVMMMTFGESADGGFTGAAYEGTQFLPIVAGKLSLIFEWLFGFESPELVAFPITALGTVGAALSLIPKFIAEGIINDNAIAVFTGMGMCWSGYLSTDAATLDSLGYRPLVPKAFLSTFIGGIVAGIIAHWTWVLITVL